MSKTERAIRHGHEYWEQLCSSSVDGTLTETERGLLARHLEECPDCAALLRDLEEMHALFAEEDDLPDGLHEQIMQRVREQPPQRVVQAEKPRRRLPVFGLVAAAAVVVLVVLGGGVGTLVGMMGAGSSAASTDACAPMDAGADFTADMSGAAADGAENAYDPSAIEKTDAARTEEIGEQDAAAGGSAAPHSSEAAAGGENGQSAAEDRPALNSGVPTRELEGGTAAPAADAEKDGDTVVLPESVHGMSVAHCYIALGTGELPDLDGTLLDSKDNIACFLLTNSMNVLENTLAAMEKAGYTVSTYQGMGLTVDDKAEDWLLIVKTA